jgi:hypothetical protein
VEVDKPLVPLRLIVPAIVTSPVAKNTTGVLAAFFVNVTATPDGMFTVVKLKMPFGGSVSVVLAVGFKAPSAPVEPLTNAPQAKGGKNKVHMRR